MRTLLICVLLAASPERPAFKPEPPHVLYEGSPLEACVWITPHASIRTVLLDAWETASDPEFPELTGDKTLVRSSAQEANEGQRQYCFRWHPLPPARYHLYGQVYFGRGLSVRSQPHVLEVR